MAEVTINNSPVHTDTILTGVYGQTGQYWPTCGFHTGTDFAPTGTTPSINAPLYSVCNGEVVQVRTESALGNVIVIKETNSNRYWRFCHMNSSSPLSVGMSVTTSTVVVVLIFIAVTSVAKVSFSLNTSFPSYSTVT